MKRFGLGIALVMASLFAWPHAELRADSPAKASTSKSTPPPLNGITIDFSYDAKDIGKPERAYMGRAFVHQKAAEDPNAERPFLVFIHGLNREKIKYRWMGGGNEGDVRRIIAEMTESSAISPVLVAAPSSIIPQAVDVAVTSWPAFDLDRFIRLSEEALAGKARIDKKRIIVAGHSGGGCNSKGGIFSVIHAKTRPLAILSIDTCMLPDAAPLLAQAPPDMHTIVSFQTQSWAGRPISDFQKIFVRESKKWPANPNVFRHIEQIRPKEPMPHDAMVPITLRTWLPKLLAVSEPAKVSIPPNPCVSDG